VAAKSRTCITITCDVCQKAWEGDNGVWQWNTLDEARSVATEENWFIRADGYAICSSMADDHDAKGRELLDNLSNDERTDLFSVRRWLEPGYFDEDDEESAEVVVPL